MQLRRNQFQNRRAYKSGRTFSVGPTTARYLILILLAVFSLMFLIQSAQGSDKVIDLQSLEKQQSDLNKELTTLQVNASRLQSLQTLNQSASQQGLTSPIENNPATISVTPN